MATSGVISNALGTPDSSCVLGNDSLPHLAHGTELAPRTHSLKGGRRTVTVLILVLGLLNLPEVRRENQTAFHSECQRQDASPGKVALGRTWHVCSVYRVPGLSQWF